MDDQIDNQQRNLTYDNESLLACFSNLTCKLLTKYPCYIWFQIIIHYYIRHSSHVESGSLCLMSNINGIQSKRISHNVI